MIKYLPLLLLVGCDMGVPGQQKTKPVVEITAKEAYEIAVPIKDKNANLDKLRREQKAIDAAKAYVPEILRDVKEYAEHGIFGFKVGYHLEDYEFEAISKELQSRGFETEYEVGQWGGLTVKWNKKD